MEGDRGVMVSLERLRWFIWTMPATIPATALVAALNAVNKRRTPPRPILARVVTFGFQRVGDKRQAIAIAIG